MISHAKLLRLAWHEGLITFNDLPGSKVGSDILFNDANFSLCRQCKRKENSSRKSPRVSSRYFQFRFIGIGSFYGLPKSGGKSFKLILRFSPPHFIDDNHDACLFRRTSKYHPVAVPSNMREFSHRNKSVADNHEIPITFNDVFPNTRCKYLSGKETLRYTPHKQRFIEITSIKGILSTVEGWKSNLKGIPGGRQRKSENERFEFYCNWQIWNWYLLPR